MASPVDFWADAAIISDDLYLTETDEWTLYWAPVNYWKFSVTRLIMAQGLTDDEVQQLVESFKAKRKDMSPITAAKEQMEKWVSIKPESHVDIQSDAIWLARRNRSGEWHY